MPYISCPHCGCSLQAPEDYEGREVRCPKCQGEFISAARNEITTRAPRPPVPPVVSEAEVDPRSSGDARPLIERRRRRVTALDDDTHQGPGFRRYFQPAGGLGLALKILLVVSIVFDLVQLGSFYLVYNLAVRVAANADVPQADIIANDARQVALAILNLAIYIATAIVFVVWFSRAYANLKMLNASQLEYTSGWAAAYWFVPFLNLIRPVQIAQEIWRNSNPTGATGNDRHISTSANSALVGF